MDQVIRKISYKKKNLDSNYTLKDYFYSSA